MAEDPKDLEQKVEEVETEISEDNKKSSGKPKKRSWFWKWIKRGFWTGILAAGIGAGIYKVEFDKRYEKIGDEITIQRIEKRILYPESEVFYADGTHKLSSLTGKKDGKDLERRKLVEYGQIPKACIESIVASEDQNFYEHNGFDYVGLLRAAFKYGKLKITGKGKKQGASTITMQVNENLFPGDYKYKPNSLKGKLLDEFPATKFLEDKLFSLCLKDDKCKKKYSLNDNFSKEQRKAFTKKLILLYYLNAIHVAGKNHGIAKAAEYYFNVKDVSKLSEIQCAFIAGSVKGPNLYTPFGKTGKSRAKALEMAKNRTVYVLNRKNHDKLEKVKDLKKREEIVKTFRDNIKKIKDDGVPFEKGESNVSTNTLADLVKREIRDNPEIQQALKDNGIDPEKIETAGLKVITTLDYQVQTEAEYILRQGATENDVKLRGYQQLNLAALKKHKQNNPDLNATAYGKKDNIKWLIKTPEKYKKNSFYVGKIKKITLDSIELDKAVIDKEGIERIIKLDKQAKRGRKFKPKVRSVDIRNFLSRFSKDDLVYFSVRDFEDGKAVCDIEQRPAFNLAAIFLDPEGRIVTLMGSYDNVFDFNYIYDGKRQPGSIMKLPIDWIAMKHGIEMTDKFMNARYPFWNLPKPYVPGNYSKSTHDKLALFPSGVKSKNRPHVDLEYRFINLIPDETYVRWAEQFDYARREDEIPNYDSLGQDKYYVRLRDEINIHFKGSRFRRFEPWIKFNWAKGQYLAQQGLSSLERKAAEQMDYGFDYERRLAMLKGKNKAGLRRLKTSYRNFEEQRKRLEQSLTKIKQDLLSDDRASLEQSINRFYLKPKQEGAEIIYAPLDAEQFVPLTAALLDQILDGSVDPTMRAATFDRKFRLEKIMLGEDTPATVIDGIDRKIAEYEEPALETSYVIQHPLVRRDLSLRYIQQEVAKIGLKVTDNDLTPALVLGSAVQRGINIGYAYNSLARRKIPQAHVVERIETRNGKVIYQATPKVKDVDIDPKISYNLAQLMHAINTSGTAAVIGGKKYSLKGEELVPKIRGNLTVEIEGKRYLVWSGGKTGTTNDLVDASYVGLFGNPDINKLYSGFVWQGEYKGNRRSCHKYKEPVRINGRKRMLPQKICMRNRGIRMTGADSAKLFGLVGKVIVNQKNFRDQYNPEQKVLPPPVEGSFYIYNKTGEVVDTNKCIPTEDHCFNPEEGEIHLVSRIYSTKKQNK